MDHPTLIIRADANSRIGAGHLMRCVALAQGWQNTGGKAVFAVKDCPPSLSQRLRSAAFSVEEILAEAGTARDAIHLCQVAVTNRASWIAVDGDDFGSGYQSILKQSGFKVLSIDDRGSSKHQLADLILNQNIRAKACLYPCRQSGTQLLLGTRYALLRREFLGWQQWRRGPRKQARKVLVTMGGADPESLTHQVVSALLKTEISQLEVIVLTGAVNEQANELAAFAQDAHLNLRVLRNVTKMPDLMAWADVAIVAAGGTLWELLYMQVPVISYAIQPAQQSALAALGGYRAVCNMGRPPVKEQALIAGLRILLDDSEARAHMASVGRSIVDGLGATRVVQALQEKPEAHNVSADSVLGPAEASEIERGAGVHVHGRAAFP